MELAWRSGQIELVAIDVLVARLAIDLHPLPGSVGDELVAAEVGCGARCFRIGGAGIELEEVFRPVAESAATAIALSFSAVMPMAKNEPSSRLKPASSGTLACLPAS